LFYIKNYERSFKIIIYTEILFYRKTNKQNNRFIIIFSLFVRNNKLYSFFLIIRYVSIRNIRWIILHGNCFIIDSTLYC